MDQIQQLEKICQAMTSPNFYPHPVTDLRRVETHISIVFLTGKWAYKLKKPLFLEFLDFQKLSDRKHFCETEVAVNQRLSSGVYVGVIPVTLGPDSTPVLAGDGPVIEYAVKMVQLPDTANFASMLEQDRITDRHIEALGEKLAAFYEKADTGPEVDVFGHPENLAYNMEENFSEIRPHLEKRADREQFEFICQVCRTYLQHHETLFIHRIQTGRIRDGHGDLRCDHVYFTNGIQIIDCIEFNQRFRYGDTALDLSFLIMDLMHRDHFETAGHLLAEYAGKAADPEIYALVDFYAAYRAMVRLKVACLSAAPAGEKDQAARWHKIRAYLSLAYHYAVMFGRPTLWIFSGLPASGKSTLAEQAASILFMPLFQSDTVRKEKQDLPQPAVVAFNTGPYHPVQRGRIYAKLLNMAQEELKSGRSVALDATFSDARWQKAAVTLARDVDAALVFVNCTCTEQTMKSRLKQRETHAGLSDARLVHLDDILKNSDPPVAEVSDTLITVDTEQPVAEALIKTLSDAHQLKTRQVRALVRNLTGS